MAKYRVQYNQAGDAFYVKELVAKGVWLSTYEYQSPVSVPPVQAPFTGIVEIKRSEKETVYRKFFAVRWWNFIAGKEVTQNEKAWLVRDYIAAQAYVAPAAASSEASAPAAANAKSAKAKVQTTANPTASSGSKE